MAGSGELRLWLCALGACLGLIAPAARAADPATPPESERAALYQRFRALNAALLDSTLGTPISNEQGQLAWHVSLHLEALVEMLEATGDTVWASQFVALADAIAAERDDRHQRFDQIRHRQLRGWGSRKYSMDHWTVWTVHTGLIVAPLAHFAALVRGNPAWTERYGAAALRCLQTARESMADHDAEFHSGPGPDEGRMLLFADSLPFNQQSVVGRAWLFIDAASDSPPYADRLARLAHHLRNHVQHQADSSLVWGYWVTLGELPTDREDISHGALGADFLVLCAEAGIEFTPADRRALARTLLEHVVKPDGQIAANVAGDGPLRAPSDAVLRWGRLARYDPGVRDTLLRLYHSDTFKSESPQSELLGLAYLIAALPATAD